MTRRSLLSLGDLSDDAMDAIVRRSAEIKSDPRKAWGILHDTRVGLYFSKPSTRTRTSFALGAQLLGAATIAYGPHDLQLNTGEVFEDTGRVLSGYLDVLVVRTAESCAEMKRLTAGGELSVVNAMSAEEHPTQALADLLTLRQQFGALDGLQFLYVGEGNNTATALALALSRIRRARISFLTPPGYGLPAPLLGQAQRLAAAHEAEVVESHEPLASFERKAHVIYTTRWQTTGTTKADPRWRRDFEPFQVTREAVDRIAQDGTAVVMHDLPAVRGDEIAADVLDGPRCVAFRQAHNKLFSAMAVLEWILLPPRS